MKITRKQLMFLIEHSLKGGIDPIPGREGYNAIVQGMNAITKEKVKKSIAQSLEDYSNFAFDGTDRPNVFGVAYDDYDTTKGVQAKDMRRVSKKIWNDNADHEFFRNNVAKLHQTAYAHSRDASSLGIDPRYLSGGGTTELSCWSLLTQNPFKPQVSELVEAQLATNSFYLVLDGRVTWCGNFDAFTEQLSAKQRSQDSKSLESAKKSTVSSGLPKRPGGVQLARKNPVWQSWDDAYDEEGKYNPDFEPALLDPGEIDWEKSFQNTPIILDREDFESIRGTQAAGEFGFKSQETIIDNWSINNVLLILDSNTGFAGKENIEDHIYDLRENDEYDILKMLGKIKWINKKQNLKVNVADLSQSRYLTDQEVQQIITGLTNMYKTKPAVVTNPFAHLQDKDK
jgi:hypothetical protein|tara:strand:- start:481 stop:1677 length:1197 start_codon:yes stop_codon:yes gene_type:complete